MNELVCLSDFETYAKGQVSHKTWSFWSNGADDEITLRRNQSAFKKLIIRPRVLRDVSSRDLSTEVLGRRVDFPIGVAPTGMMALAHPEGEAAVAKACANMKTIMINSTNSSCTIEQVAEAAPDLRRWFQLYVLKDRSLTKDHLKMIERQKFEAVVATVDLVVIGKRRAERRCNFQTQQLGNIVVTAEALAKSGHSSVTSYLANKHDSSLTWKDVDWLRSITKLPVILKGILTKEDAELAVKHGAAAVIVSNHGGRQLDTGPSTLEALPEVVEAVKGRCDVYLDGGVRTGTDVFKAIALGAKMVFVGRPVIWGLAANGQTGVERVLRILRDEFNTTMALAGCKSIEDIHPSHVVSVDHYRTIAAKL